MSTLLPRASALCQRLGASSGRWTWPRSAAHLGRGLCSRTEPTKAAKELPLAGENAERAKEDETRLGNQLFREIQFGGPMPVDRFMRQCLTHPTYGYYARESTSGSGNTEPSDGILGVEGDFVTAPEVSQTFGELIAVWLYQYVHTTAPGSPFALAELGPGKGTLMRDVLRALRALKCSPTAVHLVETSERMKVEQKSALSDIDDIEINWHGALSAVPDVGVLTSPSNSPRTLYIAQEFLDALPVAVFQKAEATGQWRERLVDVVRSDDERSMSTPLHFRFVLAPKETPAVGMYRNYLTESDAANRQDGVDSDGSDRVVELCPEGIAVAQELAARVARSGGAALIVDYGYDQDAEVACRTNTLRAIRNHSWVPALSQPGESDLTADVNFKHLRSAVARMSTHACVSQSITQREFLLRMGAAARFRRLAETVVNDKTLDDSAVDERLQRLQSEYDRLTSPAEMGTAYRVAAVFPTDTDPLAVSPLPAPC